MWWAFDSMKATPRAVAAYWQTREQLNQRYQVVPLARRLIDRYERTSLLVNISTKDKSKAAPFM